MDRNKYFVYLHRRASDGLPFYIGKGRKYRERDRVNRSRWWKNVVEKHGYSIEYLHFDLEEEESKLLEVMEINNHKALGYPLVNISLGGDGNHGWVPSDLTKQRISEGNRGKSPSAAVRLKMSESQSGRKHKDETKAKIGQANLKRADDFNKELGLRRRNKDVHGFINLDEGFFETLTQSELREKYQLNAGKVTDILCGRRFIHKGWIHSTSCGCDKLRGR